MKTTKAADHQVKTMTHKKQQVEFQRKSRSDVPFWHPVARPVTEPKGSQWDEALEYLSSSHEAAILVTETNARQRNQLKQTLQTIAKNRGINVKVRTQKAGLV